MRQYIYAWAVVLFGSGGKGGLAIVSHERKKRSGNAPAILYRVRNINRMLLYNGGPAHVD